MSRPCAVFASQRVEWKRDILIANSRHLNIVPLLCDNPPQPSYSPPPHRSPTVTRLQVVETLCSSSYSPIRSPVHNSGARAKWRFFSSGRLSTMRTTRVSWMQIRTTIAHMLILCSCIRGLPPDLQDISQGWPLGCAE